MELTIRFTIFSFARSQFIFTFIMLIFMKLRIAFYILLLGSLSAFSQKFSSHQVALTPTAYPETNFDKVAYANKLHEKFAKESKSDDLEDYIKQDILYKEYFFSSNQIYSNWPEAGNYVKKVYQANLIQTK